MADSGAMAGAGSGEEFDPSAWPGGYARVMAHVAQKGWQAGSVLGLVRGATLPPQLRPRD